MKQKELILTTMNKIIKKQNKFINLYFDSKKLYGLSQNTEVLYKKAIEDFIMFLKLNVETETAIDSTAYVEFLKDNGLKNSSIKVKLGIAIDFLKILYEHEFVSIKFLKYQKLRSDKKIKPLMTDKLYKEILDNVKPVYILMLKTLATTGLRKSELINLKVFQIRNEMNIISGKGEKQRIMILSKELHNDLNEYANKLKKKENHFLFISSHGKPFHHSTLNLILKPYGITPHDFRHKFASEMSAKGVPIIDIRDALGHSSFYTTEIYLKSNGINLINAINS